jgi:RNA polymerase sigma-70 factor (ECF subfamily)
MTDKSQDKISTFSDEELFNEIVKKQAWALSTLYDKYSPQLYGLALKILKEQALAEDALQETFLAIWEKAKDFDKKRGSHIAWMIGVCRNLCIDKLRAKYTRLKRSAFLREEMIQRYSNSQSDNPFEIVNYKETQKIITDALNQLPVDQRQAIEMAYFSGLSQTEISSELNLPLGTVKTRIRLGMQKLRDLLKQNRGK